MLFQKLYNWVKYKTLPPSILFKNRLFIERDSKSRRIFTNFGLTFRNSKWSSYSTSNVTFFFKNNYSILLVMFFFFFIIKYFSINYMYTNFFFFFWLALDSFDYYLSFFIWLASSIYITLSSSFFSFFINNKDFSKKFLQIESDVLTNNTHNIAKQDLNWFVYSWLTNGSAIMANLNEDEIFEKIFENNSASLFWKNNFDFYINLYKSIFFLNLNAKDFNFFEIKQFFNTINLRFATNYFFIFNSNNFFFKNYFWLFTNYYFLNSRKDVFFEQKSLTSDFYSKRFELGLRITGLTYAHVNHSNKIGFFYSNFFNFESIFFLKNNNLLNNLLKNNLYFYTNFIKWDRWLYKYSLLHRKSFKMLNKVSNIKKSLNFSFFNTNSYGKNLWMSSYFKQNNNFVLLFNNAISYENAFLNSNLLLSDILFKISSFKNLSFYDDSYLWFLKRFYFSNNINSNFFFMKSQFFFKKFFNSQNETFFFLNQKTEFEKIFFFFLKNKKIFLNDLNYSTEQNAINTNLKFKLFSFNRVENAVNDNFFLNNESEFFNKDFLQNLIFLTANSSYNYSTAQINQTFFLKKKKIIFFSSRNRTPDSLNYFFNRSLFRSMIDQDLCSQNDLNFLIKTFNILK